MKNEDGKKDRARRELLYGQHGVGKSVWRPDFSVEFLSFDDGDEISGHSKAVEPSLIRDSSQNERTGK